MHSINKDPIKSNIDLIFITIISHLYFQRFLNKLTKTHFVAESSCATTAVQRAWPPTAAIGMALAILNALVVTTRVRSAQNIPRLMF